MDKKRLSFGGKLIVVSIWIAIASIFVGWVQVSILAKDVISWPLIAVGMVIVLLLWSYPLQIATNRKRMSMKALVATATSAVLIPVVLGVIIDLQAFVDAGPVTMAAILALSFTKYSALIGSKKRWPRTTSLNLMR
jgi:hypothetical protein